MKYISHLLFALVLLTGAATTSALAGDSDPLFINLTSGDSHRANMAITFGGKQHELGHPLTIFLNDQGVLLASTANADKYSQQQEALGKVIGKGAAVIVCPMCMQHYGVNEADLLPGMKVGKPELTGAALFRDNTKTLTW